MCLESTDNELIDMQIIKKIKSCYYDTVNHPINESRSGLYVEKNKMYGLFWFEKSISIYWND